MLMIQPYSVKIDTFAEYCMRRKLTINASKSKMLIFGREKRQYTVHLNGEILERVRVFKYLGVMFTKKNGRYVTSMKHNVTQALKAAYRIAKRSRELNLSPSCKVHVINSVVKSILLYGCEIYCF